MKIFKMLKQNNVLDKSFFSIVGSQIIIKIIAFCNSIFLARILTKGDFGIYSYAQNFLSILLLLDGIGTISSIIQFASENYSDVQKQSAYAKFGFSIGLTFNTVLSLGIFVYAMTGSFSIGGAGKIIAIMSFQPVLSYIQNFFSCNLRFRFKNNLFSIMNVVASVINITSIIIGAYFWGVQGVAYSLYCYYIIVILIYIVVFLRLPNIYKNKLKLSGFEKKSFIKLSFSAAINDSILHLIMVMDLFLIGVLIGNELVVATYKVATVIPTALTFIPASIMLYAYPYYARYKDDLNWIKKSLFAIIGLLFIVNIFIIIILIIWAPFFIQLIYGEQYLDAVPAFRILLIGYLFTGTFRTPLVNFLWSQKKNLFVIGLSLFIGVFNIIFDIVLIKTNGALGAAYATMATYIVSAGLSILLALIVYLQKKNKIKIENDNLINQEKFNKENIKNYENTFDKKAIENINSADMNNKDIINDDTKNSENTKDENSDNTVF